MNALKTILATATSFTSTLGLRPIWSTKNTEDQPATLGKEAEEIINGNFSTLEAEVAKKAYETTSAGKVVRTLDGTIPIIRYFQKEELLIAGFPSPNTGYFAFVGVPFPGTVFNFVDGEWHDTGQIPDQPQLDLSSLADEEDITYTNNTFQFRNKAFDVVDNSGLGRIFLRKNIVGSVNHLTQEMLTDANTIYHLQYDYDLQRSTLVLPSNSVIEFDGGSLFNGNIIFDATRLDGVVSLRDCLVSGTIANDFVHPEWFGAIADNVTDNKFAFEQALSLGLSSSIRLQSGVYFLSETISINIDGTTIIGNRSSLRVPDTSSVFLINADNVSTMNVSFHSNVIGYPDRSLEEGAIATSAISLIYNRNNFSVSNCLFDGFSMGIICLYNNKNVIVRDCRFRNMAFIPNSLATPSLAGAGGYGVVLQHLADKNGTVDAIIDNCIFEETVYRHAIYIQSSKNVRITNNIFYQNQNNNITTYETRINDRGCSDVLISNNIFENGIGAYTSIEGNNFNEIGRNLIISGNIILKNLSIKYNQATIKLGNKSDVVIHNNMFKDIQGSSVNIASKVENLHISGNKFDTKSGGGSLYAITIEDHVATNDIFRNITISQNHFDNPIMGRSISFIRGTRTTLENIFITNNVMTGGSFAILLENLIYRNIEIANNRFVDISAPAIRVLGVSYEDVDNPFIFDRVKISNNYGGGVDLAGCRGTCEVSFNNALVIKGVELDTYIPYGSYSSKIRKMTWGDAAPISHVASDWMPGDICFNTAPSGLSPVTAWTYTYLNGASTWQPISRVRKDNDKLMFGSTTDRPNNIDTGFFYFDTDLKKPIWWRGNGWVDSAGISI